MTKTIFLTSLLIFQVSKLLQFNLVSKKDESVATNNLNPTTAGRDRSNVNREEANELPGIPALSEK